MSINRSNIHKPFLATSLVLALIGFSGFFGEKITGLGKGVAAISFILFLICNYLKNERTDEELSEAVASPLPVEGIERSRLQERPASHQTSLSGIVFRGSKPRPNSI